MVIHSRKNINTIVRRSNCHE